MDSKSWADQWDYNADPIGPCEKKRFGDGGNKGKYSKKMEDGFDKTKAAASNGMRKVKSGAVFSARWIKDRYHKTTQKH